MACDADARHRYLHSLEERTAIANTKAPTYSSPSMPTPPSARRHGIETYFWTSPAMNSRCGGARENATTVSKVGDLQVILRDLQMTSKRNESSLLAGSVQQAMCRYPRWEERRDLGVKHAPFLVLMGAEMASILVETGFVSNPGEERKLADPKYRAQSRPGHFRGHQRISRHRQRQRPVKSSAEDHNR